MASSESARCWADREAVRNALMRLCRSYENREDSSLDMMWANLGAGKTHALLYLQHLLKEQHSSHVYSIFVEMPEQPKNFLALFRRISPLLVADALPTGLPTRITGVHPDLLQAIRVIQHGSASAIDVASDWLSGGNPSLKDLRGLAGIGARIEDDARAVDVLIGLITIRAKVGIRTVLLLDEFQRLMITPRKAREGLLANLRSVFSSCTKHFSAVLAATSMIERSALELLPAELKTLAGPKPLISLPEMTSEDAFVFLRDRLAWFRPEGYLGDEYAPFGEEGLRAIVVVAERSPESRLIPRMLLQLAGIAYDAVLYGDIGTVTEASLESLLK